MAKFGTAGYCLEPSGNTVLDKHANPNPYLARVFLTFVTIHSGYVDRENEQECLDREDVRGRGT